jgi:hypothetical protein
MKSFMPKPKSSNTVCVFSGSVCNHSNFNGFSMIPPFSIKTNESTQQPPLDKQWSPSVTTFCLGSFTQDSWRCSLKFSRPRNNVISRRTHSAGTFAGHLLLADGDGHGLAVLCGFEGLGSASAKGWGRMEGGRGVGRGGGTPFPPSYYSPTRGVSTSTKAWPKSMRRVHTSAPATNRSSGNKRARRAARPLPWLRQVAGVQGPGPRLVRARAVPGPCLGRARKGLKPAH